MNKFHRGFFRERRGEFLAFDERSGQRKGGLKMENEEMNLEELWG